MAGNGLAAASQSLPAYRVLARKYRPQIFGDLIGQDALVRTLTNALRTGRLAQAYMLTGVRGVGKTTTARIIARALNCLGADGQRTLTEKGISQAGADENAQQENAQQDIEPCGVCTHCVSIAADRHVDVLEMDAASNTGVDDVRQIIDGVRYGPSAARQKVYIIDEVHMLSKNAFNALLKTLEEPPPHVTFIFATTEIRKVPVTVLSRCQRFDLRRVEEQVLQPHFARIAAKEQGNIEEAALQLIARAADGSVRDGLSLLDQALAQGEGLVTAEKVRSMLGLADRGRVMDLYRHILTGQMAEALTLYQALDAAGAEGLLILQDLAELTHTLSRFQAAASPPDTEMERAFASEMQAVGLTALARLWQMLLKAIQEVQQAPQPRLATEMAIIRLCLVADMPTPADLVRRLSEAGMESVSGVKQNAGANSSPTAQFIEKNAGPLNAGPLNAGHAGAYSAQAQASTSARLLVDPELEILPEPTPRFQPMPRDYRAVVALFDQQREGLLYAQLYMNAYLVRFAVRADGGQITLRLGAGAPADLPGRVADRLKSWTGQRWIITLAREEGQPSLAEQDRQARDAAYARALDSALVKGVLAAFPGAKLSAARALRRASADESVLRRAGAEESLTASAVGGTLGAAFSTAGGIAAEETAQDQDIELGQESDQPNGE